MVVTAVTVPEIQAANSAASPSSSAPTPGSVKKHHTERSPMVGWVPSVLASKSAALASEASSRSEAPESESSASSENAPSSSSSSTAWATDAALRPRRVAVSTRTGPTEVGEPWAPSDSAGTSRSVARSRTMRSSATSTHSSGGALEGAHRRSAVDSAAGSSPSTVQ